MGTNYYIHIGKRYAAGLGLLGFNWAIHPSELHELTLGKSLYVVDEYGNQSTPSEWAELIEKVTEHDYRNIGRLFS